MNDSTDTHPTSSTPSRFTRSRDHRMIAGICGRAAEALGVDANLLRILLVAATVLGFGAGVLIYLACWLIIPEG